MAASGLIKLLRDRVIQIGNTPIIHKLTHQIISQPQPARIAATRHATTPTADTRQNAQRVGSHSGGHSSTIAHHHNIQVRTE
jgi:hypothetical protein